MYIHQEAVLHIVDAAKKFSAARFSAITCTASGWAGSEECLAEIYTGLPDKICVDRESWFGDDFYAISNRAMINIGRSGMEAHSILDIYKRFLHHLRNNFREAKRFMANHIPKAGIFGM